MRKLLISGGTIVNEDKCFVGYVEIGGDRIIKVGMGSYPTEHFDGEVIDAAGKLVLPGVIDDQVHFREPGLTYKADIHSESIAAVAGGVTSFMEMPNTKPPTVTNELLEAKFERAAESSVANYSFYLGATSDNIDEIKRLDPKRVCGVKLFMGSSTGNMLVDGDEALAAIFAECPILLATHCEDETTIKSNIALFAAKYGDQVDITMHPLIRSAEACYRSSARAVELATRYGTSLHILHLSTARELDLFEAKPTEDKKITNEICVHHLWFSEQDYPSRGNFIKWNPAIKSIADREALRAGVLNGKVDMVATDHAPHTLAEKEQPYLTAPSGGPLVQHSLIAMLELASQGVFPIEKVVQKMSHTPATRFNVKQRGFLREGYYADIAIIDPNSPWVVSRENVLSKCGWSPFEGGMFSHKVSQTLVNGRVIYQDGKVDVNSRGMALEFER